MSRRQRIWLSVICGQLLVLSLVCFCMAMRHAAARSPAPANGGPMTLWMLEGGTPPSSANWIISGIDAASLFNTNPDLIFQAGGTELLRVTPDGAVFVRGERVDSNKRVYLQFRKFLDYIDDHEGACRKYGPPL